MTLPWLIFLLTLRGPANDIGDDFGQSIAMDGNTLVVGAPGESSASSAINGDMFDNSARASGAAFVYVRDAGGNWTLQAFLKAANVNSGDNFGNVVAISGDTIAVAATGEDGGDPANPNDNSSDQSGAVYIFVRNGTTWTQQAYLKSPEIKRRWVFGFNLSLFGDSLAVSECDFMSDPRTQCIARVFQRSGTSWTVAPGATFVFPFADRPIGAGLPVALGDGVIALGGAAAPDRGGVSIYRRNIQGIWQLDATIPTPAAGNFSFGSALSMSGNSLAIGDWLDGSCGRGVNPPPAAATCAISGAGYVFVRNSNGAWTQQAYIKASNAEAGDQFGFTIRMKGDVLLVGSRAEQSIATGVNGNQDDNSIQLAGAAYVYERTGTAWNFSAYLKQEQLPMLNSRFSKAIDTADRYVAVGGGGWQSANNSEERGHVTIFRPTVSATSITISASLAGQPFTVTGSGCNPGEYVSPRVFAWLPGTSCQVAFPATQGDTNAMYLSFTGWNDGTTTPSRTIATPTAATEYQAVIRQFAAVRVQIRGTGVGSGNFLGTSCTADCTAGAQIGSAVSIEAVAASGSVLQSFGGGCDSVSGNNRCNLTLNAPATITVTFGIVPTGPPASHFVPIVPCRSVDTRIAPATAINANGTRDFAFTNCGVPASASAIALNVTVVPRGRFGFLTIWPAGQTQPLVSTLNSIDGRVKANAAIVGLGTAQMASVFVTDAADVVLDVNGYFVPPGTSGELAFFDISPCRVWDTRANNGLPISAQGTRAVTVGTGCLANTGAQAYSLNATVVPDAIGSPLGFLTLFPQGASQPTVSTLNNLTGTVVANAALLRAGTGGAFNAFVTDRSHLVLDLNGYFAPPQSGNGKKFYALRPCRAVDTRSANGPLGGPRLEAGVAREFNIVNSGCGVPANATSIVANATVVPSGLFGFLTLWAAGGPRPTVSTLNALDGVITSNAAIVPLSSSGAIQMYGTEAAHIVLDISGYFAP